MKDLLKIAIKAALDAGKSILEIYNSGEFNIEVKEDNSPLTRADIASHKVIMSHLKDTDIPVLSEEGREISYQVRKDWKQLWIVDPIDGTKEFIKRNGEFTVNIALIENQRLLIGVVFVPFTGDLYFSSIDMGSFKVVIDLENFDVITLIEEGIRLPLKREDETFTIVASRSHMSADTEKYVNELRDKYGEINLVTKGSSLKLCIVAEGKADCYPRLAPTMEWDTAAGQAICEHAGFKAIDWQTNKKLLYNKRNLINSWFVVKKN